MKGKVQDYIDLTTEQYQLVRELLRQHLPGIEVWAYGSRVKFTSHADSDLDLVAFAPPEQKQAVSDLRTALARSDLPFEVELFAWDDLPESFHKNIQRQKLVLQQKAEDSGTGGGWREYALAEVADIIGGGTPSSKQEECWAGDVPWITPKDLSQYPYRYIGHGVRSLSALGLKKSSARLLPSGAVLVTSRAPVGYVAIAEGEVTTNQGFKNLVLKEGHDPLFFYYLMKHNVPVLEAAASGTVFKELSGGTMKQLRFRVPPYAEQRAIAHILGTLDDKIELNRRMSETLEATAQALFKSWFIDFDPVIDNALAAGSPIPQPLQARAAVRASRKHTDDSASSSFRALFPSAFTHTDELGWIPDGWAVSSLDRIAEYLNGLACQKYPAQPGGRDLPVIKIRELRSGSCDQADRATDKVPSKYLVQDGDILFSWSGTLLVKPWVSGEGVLNQHLFKVTSQDYPRWFYYFWTRHHLQEFIGIAADKATTMGHIKRHHLTDARVCIPCDGVMQAADSHLEAVWQAAIDKLLENRQLAEIHEVLLPRLLSGKLAADTGHASVVAGSEDA